VTDDSVEERGEAVETIRQFVRGEIDDDALLSMVEKFELRSLHQVSEALGFRTQDFRRIGFRGEDLVRPLGEFLSGRMELGRLRRRVRALAQLFSCPEYRSSSACRPELAEALSLLWLVLDPGAPLPPESLPGYLDPVLAALAGRKLVPFHEVLKRILEDLGEFHFISLTLDLSSATGRRRPPWSDLALLYQAPPARGPGTNGGSNVSASRGADSGSPRSGAGPDQEDGLSLVWFIPLSVTTRSFYQQIRRCLDQDGSDGDPLHGNCQVARLRERHPWLPVAEYRPAYFLDPRGFAEIVLDVPRLSRQEVAFAVRAFSLLNAARAASLDGEPIELYPSCKSTL